MVFARGWSEFLILLLSATGRSNSANMVVLLIPPPFFFPVPDAVPVLSQAGRSTQKAAAAAAAAAAAVDHHSTALPATTALDLSPGACRRCVPREENKKRRVRGQGGVQKTLRCAYIPFEKRGPGGPGGGGRRPSVQQGVVL